MKTETLLVVCALVLSGGIIAITLFHSASMISDKNVTNACKGISPKDVTAIVFEMPNGPAPVKDQKTITELLAGLKKAQIPRETKKAGTPGNRVFRVKIILKDQRTVGPFGFAPDGWKYAFSKEFVRAFNKISPKLKIPLD